MGFLTLFKDNIIKINIFFMDVLETILQGVTLAICFIS